MATIKFRVLTKKVNSSITIRFSIQRGKVLQTTTGYIINYNDWSFDNHQPKNTKSENKKLITQLNDLKNYILKSYNRDLDQNIDFNNEWLKKQIERFKSGISVDLNEINLLEINQKKEKENLVNYINSFYELRKLDPSISKQTNEKIKTLKDKVISFEKHIDKTILIPLIDRELLLRFREWLISEGKLSESTVIRTIKNLKTVLLDAANNEIYVTPQAITFKQSAVKTEKVFLNFEEIEQIKKAKIIGDNNLTIARDWLIIGCYTGQRVSDLLRMNKSMIYKKINSEGKEFNLIELTQQKTKTDVSIPIHPEVEQILKKYNNNFPPIYSTSFSSNETLFNRYLKKVCKIAEINTIVKGKEFDKEQGRNIIVEKEKWRFVSSHICRRSFATNFYADANYTTPQLMAITGHKTEFVFLQYIGKTSKDYAIKTAETFAEIHLNKNLG